MKGLWMQVWNDESSACENFQVFVTLLFIIFAFMYSHIAQF